MAVLAPTTRMTLKIDKHLRKGFTVFGLSGRIEARQTADLEELLGPKEGFRNIILDLKETRLVLVDRDTVQFLIKCEAKMA